METQVIRIGVVGHTARQAEAQQLANLVDADVLSIDDGTLGCEGNHRTVQTALSQLTSTWSVILEDDAVPVPGFRDQLADALIHAPSPLVSLYLGRLRPDWAQDKIRTAVAAAQTEHADWIISTYLYHAVGYAIKTDLLPSLLHFPPTPLDIDKHITRWAKTYGHVTSYVWPSLVDHADTPTVITQHLDNQPRTPGRTAWRTRHFTSRTITMKV